MEREGAQFQLCVLNKVGNGKEVKIILEVKPFRLILPHPNVSKESSICSMLIFLHAKNARKYFPHEEELKVEKC